MKAKPILLNVFLVLSLATMAGFFFYGYDYYHAEYQQRVEQANLKGELARSAPAEQVYHPDYYPALLIGEASASETKQARWHNLYFLSVSQPNVLTVETAHEIAYAVKPVANSRELFYYESGAEDDLLSGMILRSVDLTSGREEKIVSATEDFSPLGIWVSSDGQQLRYLRAMKKSGEYVYWSYRLTDGVTRELMNAAAGYYPAPYQQWNPDSERFYFTERVGDNSYVLQEAREAIISPAFPVFNWDQLDWSDLWQVKPLAVAPDGLAAVYLDRRKNGDLVVSTDINIIDQSGGTTHLINLPGDIYELIWSPSGKMIAFNYATHDQTGRREKAAIWVMESNGDNPVKIYEANDAGSLIQDLHWSKDGKEIYFLERSPRKYSLVQAVAVAGGQVRTLRRQIDDEQSKNQLRILQYLEIPKALSWQSSDQD